MTARRIFVVGSLNMDLVQSIERLPRPGETMVGGTLRYSTGGKGGNQVRAAAKLQAAAKMIGKVGDDAFGNQLRRTLEAEGVDVSSLLTSSHPSGTAIVMLMPDGENLIVIAPGANADLSPADVRQHLSSLALGDILLCQLEVPLETVKAALAFAKSRGAVTVLDPAPAQALPRDLLTAVDIITPNEVESAVIGTLAVPIVIRKLGASGCSLTAQGQTRSIPGFVVSPVVDTTGAGDTFNAAFAAAISRMDNVDRLTSDALGQALSFANAAAALSVTRAGAGDAAPALAEVQQFLRDRRVEARTIMDS